jgi:hypothetical protein
MTNRDAQLKAYREYLEALHEAEQKKPEGLQYKVDAHCGIEKSYLKYNPEDDSLEFFNGCYNVKIQGAYLKAFKDALVNLFDEKL